jgi:hypothetical protein
MAINILLVHKDNQMHRDFHAIGKIHHQFDFLPFKLPKFNHLEFLSLFLKLDIQNSNAISYFCKDSKSII